ncbi:unnamed protein product [Orchesella dallaii]|uniref:Uncharacterized protein n=1 Tax=Orchesella dallaii TaxID=48710 RepID=A0ABP1RHS8_9HEXA
MVSNQLTFSIESNDTLKNHQGHQHFSSCFILGYVDFQDAANSQDSSTSTDVQSVLNKMPVAEKPNHFIYFANWQFIREANLSLKTAKFFKLLLPTTFISGMTFLMDSSQQINLVCITCTNTFHKLTKSQIEKPFHLQLIWNSLHSNLNGISISSVLTKYQIRRSNTKLCDKLAIRAAPLKYLPTPLMCAYKILAKKLNFSIVSNEDAQGSLLYLSLSPTNLKFLEDDTSNDFISYGMTVTSFSFIVVKNSHKYKWAPFLPFEAACWISFILITFAMLILSKYSSGSWSTNLFSIVASILEQSLQLGCDLKLYHLHNILWIIMIFILNGAYKGIMFSNITKGPKLDWPKTFTEFLLLPCNKVTITSLYILREGKYIVSNSLLHETFQENNSNFSTKSYSQVGKSVTHFAGNEAEQELVYQALIDSTPPIDEVKVKLNTSEFGVVDQETTTIQIRHAFNIFGKEKTVSLPETIEKFTLSSLWICQINFLQRFLNNGLGQLDNAGLFNRLIKNYKLIQSLMFLEDILEGNYSLEPEIASNLFIHYLEDENVHKEYWKKAEPFKLSLKCFENLFIIFLILLFFATFIQAVECYATLFHVNSS